MGQNTTKLATIYAGRGVELHVIADHNATQEKRIKIYKKWYRYNNENDFGWHRQKIGETGNYIDALQHAVNYIFCLNVTAKKRERT